MSLGGYGFSMSYDDPDCLLSVSKNEGRGYYNFRHADS